VVVAGVVTPAPPPPSDRPVRHVVVEIAPRSIVFALVVFVALALAYSMLTDIPAVLIRASLGTFLALALNPVVDAARRRLHVGRAAAVTVVAGGFLVAATAFGILAVPRAVNQIRQVGPQVSQVISDLDDLPLAGRAIRDNGIDQRVADFLDELPDTAWSSRRVTVWSPCSGSCWWPSPPCWTGPAWPPTSATPSPTGSTPRSTTSATWPTRSSAATRPAPASWRWSTPPP
jgi:hypothetical protein